MTSSCLCLYLFELTTCRAITGFFTYDNVPDTCADKNLLHYQIANPVMNVFPFWIRSIQCMYKIYECKKKGTPWRNHALNLGKYSSAIFLVISSVLQVTLDDPAGPYWTPLRFHWLLWILVKSVYCSVWDIRMDWGLWRRPKAAKPSILNNSVFSFSPSRIGPSRFTFDHLPSPRTSFGSGSFEYAKVEGANTLSPISAQSPEPNVSPNFPWRLRAHRKLGTGFYYFALVSNLLMRFSWSLAITAWSFYPDFPPSWADILAFVEIGRRAQWMIIRIEFEYWNLRAKYPRQRQMAAESPSKTAAAEPAETEPDNERQLLLFY